MKYPFNMVTFGGPDASLVIRIVNEDHDESGTLVQYRAEVLLKSPFLRGKGTTHIGGDELAQWQDFLDSLDAGMGGAWREGARNTSITADPDVYPDRVWLEVKDPTYPGIVPRVLVYVDDRLLDDAYARVEKLLNHASG
jgi:hypothetical protein